MFTQSLPFQVALLLVSVGSLITFAIKLGQTRDKRRKVAAAFSLWIAMTLTFAAVYGTVYLLSPETFRVTRDFRDKTVRDQIDRNLPELRKLLQQRHVVELIAGSADRVAAAVTVPKQNRPFGKGVMRVKDGRAQLTQGVTFEYYDEETEQFAAQGELTYSRHVVMSVERGDKAEWRISPSLLILPHPDPEQKFARALLDVKDKTHVERACARYESFLSGRIRAVDTALSRAINAAAPLEVSDFLLLSASISTTIGSADISPDSRATRYLVILHAFMTVFIFGYALEILWHETA